MSQLLVLSYASQNHEREQGKSKYFAHLAHTILFTHILLMQYVAFCFCEKTQRDIEFLLKCVPLFVHDKAFLPLPLLSPQAPPNQKVSVELNTGISGVVSRWEFKLSFVTSYMRVPEGLHGE